MKIVFLSNIFSHHQKPLSDELYRLNPDYFFVETEDMHDEQRNMGYAVAEKLPYVLSYEHDRLFCDKLINEADVVIIGSAPEQLIKRRKWNSQLVVRYSERPLKKKMNLFYYLYRLVRFNLMTPFWKPIYMLCAGAYVAGDYKLFGMYMGKTYKWGYFTSVKEFESMDDILERKQKKSILWASRLIPWKHPEIAIELAGYLKDRLIPFEINIIGTGICEKPLKKMVEERLLNDEVHLLGVMDPVQVREYMECSEIFISTSDRMEGWGATVNEAMSSLCAVVADERIGSVPYLIENGGSGFSYKTKQELFEIVENLLQNNEKRKKIAKNAYQTMRKQWNPKVAASRLLTLFEKLKQKGQCDLFESGPCSRA
jgi:glycosyltransferase involved in cell wall biosynthesis